MKAAMQGWFGLLYYRWVDWQKTSSSVSLGWHLDIESGCLLTTLGVSCSVLENSPLCSNSISFLWESCIFEDWVAFSSWWWSSLIFMRNESILQSFISAWDASSCLFLEIGILVSMRETNELSRWSWTCEPMRRERLKQLSSRMSIATWPDGEIPIPDGCSKSSIYGFHVQYITHIWLVNSYSCEVGLADNSFPVLSACNQIISLAIPQATLFRVLQ